MNKFSENLKKLRKAKGLTQSQLAEKLSINRATLASYEEGRAEPKFDKLQKIAGYFKVNIDSLLLKDLNDSEQSAKNVQKDIHILPIVVDKDENERITLVSKKARAGYLEGFSDPVYVENLPSFNLPFDKLSAGTYRAFEIEGDSMLPISPGSLIIARYEDDWKSVKDGSPYIVVSQSDGLSFKRIELDFRKETIELVSDNKGYEPYTLSLYDVVELWKAVAFMSFDLGETKHESKSIGELSNMFHELKKEIEELKSSTK